MQRREVLFAWCAHRNDLEFALHISPVSAGIASADTLAAVTALNADVERTPGATRRNTNGRTSVSRRARPAAARQLSSIERTHPHHDDPRITRHALDGRLRTGGHRRAWLATAALARAPCYAVGRDHLDGTGGRPLVAIGLFMPDGALKTLAAVVALSSCRRSWSGWRARNTATRWRLDDEGFALRRGRP